MRSRPGNERWGTSVRAEPADKAGGKPEDKPGDKTREKPGDEPGNKAGGKSGAAQLLRRWPLSKELEVVSRALAATLAPETAGDREPSAALPEQLHRAKMELLQAETASQQRSAHTPMSDSDSSRVLREMAAGAMRRWGHLGALVQAMQSRPEQINRANLSAEVAHRLADALLRVALHCLESEPDKAHRIVDQAVECAKRVAPGSAAYINAILRRFGREREALLAKVKDQPIARWNFPPWWIESLQREYPAAWEQVLTAALSPSPLTLRVNRRRTSRPALLRRLLESGHQPKLPGHPHTPSTGALGKLWLEDAIVLDPSTSPLVLPGFDAGHFSVQDLAAQQAGHLLELADGQRVLDACAAPGGKTAQMLELADCEVHAWDVSAHRLRRLETNLLRLGLGAQVHRADLLEARSLPKTPALFDRILLDAPCSASGIAGRHPEIRWRRHPEELREHHQRQQAMLAALWPRLAPGGLLLFATCSVFPEEGRDVIAAFGGQRPRLFDAETTRIWALLPRRDEELQHDGFFYASLRKRQF